MSKLQLVTSQLVSHLSRLAREAVEINWITAFAMKSGVRIVTPFLKEAADRGVPIKLLIGDYLFVTQPEALKILLEELPSAEIRLWKSGGASFHPKSYLFRGKETSHLIVGSSNLSRSALTEGVEWNLIAPTSVDETVFDEATEQFLAHFYADETIPLNKETLQEYKMLHEKANLKRPISPVWSEAEETGLMLGSSQPQEIVETGTSYITELEPRPAQQEALDALDTVIEEEYTRAMAVLATGLGKTYLAAFFAKKFKRVLFVAHRQEILQQAKESFQKVHPHKKSAFYHATEKDTSADFLFASIYTLGSEYHLDQFERNAFDLIVVDEFHHAASPTYRRLLEHFEPQFLLGITATPDRMDNQDVYALCDGNVAISIHFLDAIERNWLAPFRYFGVYDNTDYSKIRWLGNRYDEEELLQAQLREEYAEAVFEAWQKHKQTRTIVFCSTIRQTQFMDQFFRERGIRSMSLSGGTPAEERKAARAQLDSGELEIIFTVDLFNEGVDIPKVDTLLFIRPTESLTVYTQQIGRGLRIADEKDHCVIIDFIGNYRNADLKLSVFDTAPQAKEKTQGVEPLVPANCDFNLELAVVNLLEELRKKRAPRKESLVLAYRELKRELGRRPTYLEFHLKGTADSKTIKQEFGSWFGLLAYAAELNADEIEVWTKHQNWLLEVEKTGMNKSYKMVVLSYMLSKGVESWLESITPVEAAPYFHEFLTAKQYRLNADFNDVQGRKLRDYDEKKIADLIERMPMTKWSGSAKDGLVTFDDNLFSLNLSPSNEHQRILYEWTKEIAEYRLHAYFERKAANRN
ncbi:MULTISPECIES: DEAD/DEAH box helicase family protein [unclassified Planococcus (in: firmicutes)]|uniref:DEAD/DEAH box helicase family protein n=1 Tax=unclassified Planococcus (in: firmicutes) TaxID=2662419 RepID=UPI000C335C79|nr:MULTISPECIES: DEAD/DEAH box helicase family protein [unclassified Planococcus (in: firmicutes)]AUD14906.1 DNA helicase [Planococcus sp. MB-3u-03]PKG45229.1 DNA helicase [Planococcus sp. Urea-trap-24]PKG87571.1 DNA helicase [Planococcus sp. Urea-3u-39]PKH41562.1 DNA helicase [Planococcus sp. MB-3u-09]